MTDLVKGLNRLLSFLLEIAMLMAFAVYGAAIGVSTATKILLAFAFFIMPLAFWATYMAPHAKKRIAWPWTPIVALLLFLVASLALLLAHQREWAMILAAVAIFNAALTFIFKQK